MLLWQAVLILIFLASAAYGVYEVRRWSTTGGLQTVSPRQRRLRGWGLFFLLAALALAIGATTLPPPPHLTATSTRHARIIALRFMACWTLIALLLLPLIPLALLDARENIRRYAQARHEERENLLRGTLTNTDNADDHNPPSLS